MDQTSALNVKPCSSRCPSVSRLRVARCMSGCWNTVHINMEMEWYWLSQNLIITPKFTVIYNCSMHVCGTNKASLHSKKEILHSKMEILHSKMEILHSKWKFCTQKMLWNVSFSVILYQIRAAMLKLKFCNCGILDGLYKVGGKLDSRFPTTRGGIPFLSIRTYAQSYNPGVIFFSIASQHDLDIGHQGHLGTNKSNGSVKHSTYEVLVLFQ